MTRSSITYSKSSPPPPGAYVTQQAGGVSGRVPGTGASGPRARYTRVGGGKHAIIVAYTVDTRRDRVLVLVVIHGTRLQPNSDRLPVAKTRSPPDFRHIPKLPLQ